MMRRVLIWSFSVVGVVCSAAISKSLSFGVITDVHIGESCGGDLSFEGCKPVRTLTDAVNKMNDLGLDGVFITGDLTASALLEEFQKFREIVDELKMPWWPLFGNHDSWPYTRHDGTFNQTDSPIGDQYFGEVFGDILVGDKSKLTKSQSQIYAPTTTTGWPTKSCANQDYTYNSWFHNFEVSYPLFSKHFRILALDWVSRGAALPEPGVGPEAELHDYDCGTGDWLSKHLALNAQEDEARKFFIFQHHPFHNWDILDPFGHNRMWNFTFDDKQDKRVQQILSEHYPVSAFLGSQGGHNHRWFDGPAFTKYTALSDDWRSVPAWETPACKGWFFNEDFVSAIQVFTFKINDTATTATSSSGGIRAEEEEGQEGEVYLANVLGLWKVPNGEWMVKPVM